MPLPSDPDLDASAYLVERYLPPGTVAELPASVARLCAVVGRSSTGVQYLHSAYVPTEDTCFCLFRGPSADAVRAVNNEADFALDRITNVVLVHPSSTNPATHRRHR